MPGKPVLSEASSLAFITRQVQEYRYFFLNLNPPTDVPLTVVCGGWERSTPHYQIDRSDFQFYSIEYVVQGKGMLRMNGVETRLLPGSVFAYRPRVPHTITTDRDDPIVRYFVSFIGQDAERIMGEPVLGPNSVASVHDTQPIHDLCEEIVETGIRGGVMASRLCVGLLEMLSLRIEEQTHNDAPARGRARQSFERCRNILREQFHTLQSVAELAAITELDPAYLTRLFIRFVREGPHDMLIRLKMTEAAGHLAGKPCTVKEAAMSVGYTDPYYFSRVFKKYYGMPPAKFRRTGQR
jgi:AraC-like DNA-binding protein